MKIAICFIILATGFILGFMWANSEYMRKDHCLDNGGKWNKEHKYCEYGKEK